MAGARASQTLPKGYKPPIKGRRFIPLEEARQVPMGSFIDTRFGRTGLTSATEKLGTTQTGQFSGGVFQVLQSRKRSARGLTQVVLKGEQLQPLHASFRWKGAGIRGGARDGSSAGSGPTPAGASRAAAVGSSATTRGTAWETVDRCDGTLTKVTRGRVSVRDFRRRRNILVRAGKSYFARLR